MFLIDGSDEDWWYMISIDGGRKGFVPNNYISIADVCQLDRQHIQLVKKLGAGMFEFGEMWEGQWNGTSIVVKSLKLDFVTTSECLKEAAAMYKLQHSNVLPLYAVCSEGSSFYFVTEFMERGSLLEYLRGEGRSLKLPQLIDKAAQIATGMAYMEEQHYVHGGLALRNVLLTEDLTCKVADHGIIPMVVKSKKQPVEDVYLHLPVKWIAPEAIHSKRYTIKSDAWSFGIVLYEIITYGRFPYPGITNRQLLNQLQSGYRMSCPMGCPEKLYNVMLSCWKENAEDRPTFETLKWFTEEYFTIDKDGYQYMPL